MPFRLQFEGIRCFSTPQEAVIRPLTLLVGENSSGKTTFLALCRLAHAIVAPKAQPLPFNKPPFFWGAFDQIASNSTRQTDPLRSFSLTIVLDRSSGGSLRAEFQSRSGQASLHGLRLTSKDIYLEVATEADKAILTMHGTNGERTIVSAEDPPEAPDWLVLPVMYASLRKGGSSAQAFLSVAQAVLSDADVDALQRVRQAIKNEVLEPYAFAPIRMSPRRTYDPVDSSEEPEGSHIPMMLAALSRSAGREKWTSLRSDLTDFGSKSGLFDGIEIVNKGERESDPFQVGVRSGGPVFNLIDVGYGVSQALPILVDILRQSSSNQLFLIQQPEVHLHPRAQAELGSLFARQAREKNRLVVETHSDYLVDRARMEVRSRTLHPEDVSLLYFERVKHGATIHHLELDKEGSIIDPPPGYRQFFLNEERSLLGV